MANLEFLSANNKSAYSTIIWRLTARDSIDRVRDCVPPSSLARSSIKNHSYSGEYALGPIKGSLLAIKIRAPERFSYNWVARLTHFHYWCIYSNVKLDTFLQKDMRTCNNYNILIIKQIDLSHKLRSLKYFVNN